MDKLNTVADLMNNQTNVAFLKDIIQICHPENYNETFYVENTALQYFSYHNLNQTIQFLEQAYTLMNRAEYYDFFKAVKKSVPLLKSVEENTELIKLVDIIEDIKKLNTESIENMRDLHQMDNIQNVKDSLRGGLNIVKSVASEKNNLKTIEDSMRSLKGSMKVVILESAFTHTRNLGTATRGLLSMKQLLNDKMNMEALKNNQKLIQDVTSASKTLSSQDSATLNQFGTMVKEFDKLFGDLEQWKAKTSKAHLINLQDYDNVFESALKVNGLKRNISEMVRAIDSLILSIEPNNVTSQIDRVLMVMRRLEGINCNFVPFHQSFIASKQSLYFLDQFFSSHSTTVNSSTPTPTSSQSQNSTQKSVGKTNLPNEKIEWLFLASILLLTFFSLITGGYLTMRIYRMDGFNLNISYRPPNSEIENRKKKNQ